MTPRDSPTAGRPRGHIIRSVFVSLLAMTAMLLGLLAMHSASSGAPRELAVTSPASAIAEHTAGMNQVKAGAAAVGVVEMATNVDSGWLGFGTGFMVGCGILALTCAVLLIVVALNRCARQPSVYARLCDAGGLVVRSVRSISLEAHRPSLTLLSISRV